jgi:hypothetical protein
MDGEVRPNVPGTGTVLHSLCVPSSSSLLSSSVLFNLVVLFELSIIHFHPANMASSMISSSFFHHNLYSPSIASLSTPPPITFISSPLLPYHISSACSLHFPIPSILQPFTSDSDGKFAFIRQPNAMGVNVAVLGNQTILE